MIVKVLPKTNGIALEFPYCLIRVISMSMGLIGCFKLTLLSHLRGEDHAVRFLRFLSDPSLPPCLGGSAFLCNLCGEKFSSIQDLQPHLDYHKEGRKQCPVCHLWMRGNSSYRCHVRRHSDGKPFKCDKCSYETNQRRLFRRHVRVQHDKREKHACPVCPTELTSKNGLKLHLLRHTGEGKHKCSLCPSVFPYLSTLKNHMALTHNKTKVIAKVFKCEECDKSFISEVALERHVTTHGEDRNLKCRFCEKTFKTKYSLQQHEDIIHLGKFTCSICGKNLYNRKDFASHLELHHEMRSESVCFNCEVCGKSFASNNYLQYHKKVHEKEKPYQCSQCDKAIHRHAFLQQHMVIHTDARPFKCTLCEMAFKAKRCLKVHMERHVNEKNFKCTECSATFKTKSDLTRHMRSKNMPINMPKNRSEECEYFCEQCGVAIFLKQHMIVHSDVRNFACRHCSYRTKRKFALKKHEKTHFRYSKEQAADWKHSSQEKL